ncbi:hypothetical protein [Bradyrhizobium tropiciagri]|uniref:hypothetical protein n=1 Tax=Bradyrhizobium tropiciagri TaxID=312253 RepID=UPI001009C927|nr:hypothetical protein [Bradyrhizobium tropiciagri]
MDKNEHMRVRTESARKPAKTDSRKLSITTMALVTVTLLASAYVIEIKPVLTLLDGTPVVGDQTAKLND